MRGVKISAVVILIAATAFTALTLIGFQSALAANGEEYIISRLNTHLRADKVQGNKGRVVDRDGLAWPSDQAKAIEMLAQWKDEGEAINAMESFYHILYGGEYGIASLEWGEFLGWHNGIFRAADGIRDIYEKKGNDVYITVSGVFNERLNKAISPQADDGGAILFNYKTGEILGWTLFPAISLAGERPDASAGGNNMESLAADSVMDRVYQSESMLAFAAALPEALGAGANSNPKSVLYACSLISAAANSGRACRPYIVSRIASREDGGIIEQANAGDPAFIAGNAAQIKSTMESACSEGGAASTLGEAMKKLGYVAAAKTGKVGNVSWIACFLEEKPFAFIFVARNAKDPLATAKIASEMLPLAIGMNLDMPQFTD